MYNFDYEEDARRFRFQADAMDMEYRVLAPWVRDMRQSLRAVRDQTEYVLGYVALGLPHYIGACRHRPDNWEEPSQSVLESQRTLRHMERLVEEMENTMRDTTQMIETMHDWMQRREQRITWFRRRSRYPRRGNMRFPCRTPSPVPRATPELRDWLRDRLAELEPTSEEDQGSETEQETEVEET